MRAVKLEDGMRVYLAKGNMQALVDFNRGQLITKHPKILLVPIRVNETDGRIDGFHFEVYMPLERAVIGDEE